MKKWLTGILVFLVFGLTACAGQTRPAPTEPNVENITEILLNGSDVTVQGNQDAVFVSNDIIYYEDRDFYESGNPYGEGENWQRHSAAEAAEHLVVNITQPGNYRLSGELTLGQIRVDLGEDAYESPSAVVNLVLDNVNINCTVAPAILFLNVYECDGDWDADTVKPDVDTTSAGANLILAENSENVIRGSHVAKIYKDKDGEKKLWKQDGAIYSYMSMNVFGPGKLGLYADNEGMDTELHLTVNGGDITIRADNDGINTNEDGVSVTTINGGNIHILAGLGAEGDGIDSNGYLVINGGRVISWANPKSDSGLDSDLGSFIHGGTVIALGSTMDWPESESGQVTINLQFNRMQSGDSSLVITGEDGKEVFNYDLGQDGILSENVREYMGAVISCPDFAVGDTYQVFVDGIQQAYTGTDVMRGPGGMPPFEGGQRSEGGPPDGMMPALPEGEMPEGQIPPGGFGQMGQMPPEGGMPTMPEGAAFPGNQMPEDFTMPSGPEGEIPPGSFGPIGQMPVDGERRSEFYMQDKVNFFSGVAAMNE